MHTEQLANFVSSYVDYTPAAQPHEMPRIILTPAATLQQRSGNAFDMAMLLASLLAGAEREAHVAVGYAPVNIAQNVSTSQTYDAPAVARLAAVQQLVLEFLAPGRQAAAAAEEPCTALVRALWTCPVLLPTNHCPGSDSPLCTPDTCAMACTTPGLQW